MSRPLISVLMVAHNAGEFLKPAVQSVLEQEGVDVEVVLVDNGGTDGLAESLAVLGAGARLRIVHCAENRHHAGGLNAGLPHCRGEYVAMMDPDDLSAPDRLDRQLTYLRAHPEIDGVFCFEQEMDSQGRRGAPAFCVINPEQFVAYSRFESPFAAHNMMFRRHCLAGLPWRGEFFLAADFDLLQRAAETLRLGCVPAVLYFYRVHTNMVSLSRATAQLHMAAICRLVGARRRAGRPEDLAGLSDEIAAARAGRLPVADLFVRYAGWFLRERFYDLALVFARRAWATGHRTVALGVALRALARGLVQPATDRRLLLRMALLGPAHALRIQSHPPLRPRGWNLFASRWRRLGSGLPDSSV